MNDQRYNLISGMGTVIYSNLLYTEAEHFQSFHSGSDIVCESEEDYWQRLNKCNRLYQTTKKCNMT